MELLELLLGRFWWCLEYNRGHARLARFVHSRRGLHRTDFCEGTLEECKGYLEFHKGSMDGVLVVDDTLPVRLLSTNEYALLPADGDDAVFLPGFAKTDFKVLVAEEEGFIGLCLDRSCEVLVAELERKGFAPLQVIPSAFLYPSMFSVQPDLEGEIFIRATDTYYDIWIYGEGVFQAYHRIVKDRITSFFNQFCPEHYPAVASFPVHLLNGDTSSVDSLQKEIGLSVTIVAQKHDILESLAEDAWLFGWEKLPSLGTGKDTIPSKRLHESAAFRKVLKIAGTFLAFSLALVGVLGLFVAGYGFYTRSDRIDLEKKASIGRELSSMSEKLEKDRVEAESLLRHRTRHASPLSLLVQALPEGMWLTRWDIQGGRYFIQGFATEAQDVSIFLSRLEESPAFTQVRLRTTEKTNWKRKPVVRFDLVAEEK